MARLPKQLDPGTRAELMRSPEGQKELRDFERKRRKQLDKDYPKPTEQDIAETVRYLQTRFDGLHNGIGTASATAGSSQPAMRSGNDQVAGINGVRDMRYHRDELPDKWQRDLQGAVRLRSNLTNSEIGNVAGILGRNPIKARIPPIGSLADAVGRAASETRWSNALPDALEREAGLPIRQEVNDALAEDSVCAVEVYLTDAYDDIKFDRVKVPGAVTGTGSPSAVADDNGDVEESDSEYQQRIEAELLTCGLPFGIRPIDPLALYFDRDQYGNYVAVIRERKPYSLVFSTMRSTLSDADWKRAQMPQPWSEGVAERYQDYTGDGVVLTTKYYDRRWYVYEVGGEIVECKEHGLPGLPVIVGLGKVTSSPTLAEKYQGVTWGMSGIERALNDRLTLDFDVQVTYSRPLPYVETDAGAQLIRDTATSRPAVLDLKRGVLQLNPGQHLKDATAGFRVQHTEGLDLIMGLFTRSGMNPVAQGESPGTDASGYAINSLQSGALNRYQPWIEGIGRFWEEVIDFLRLTVRDTIQEDVYLTAPMQNGTSHSGLEWLCLSPEGVTEVPCQVHIDPLSETNRAAIAEWYGSGVDRGLVPEEILMERGYGAESTEEWYRAIDLDAIRRALRGRAVQETLATIDAAAQAQPGTVPTQTAPDGTPLPPTPTPQGQPAAGQGGTEPDTAPTVGAPNAQASQGAYSGGRPGGGTRPRGAFSAGQRPPQQGVTAGEAGPS